MAGSVVEVVVRFGDTLVDVARVSPRETYRIGTAPDLELAVPGYTSFPLVVDGEIRCPRGVRVVATHRSMRFQLGLLTFEITRCEAAVERVGAPRPSLRMPLFALGSLAVHVAIWCCAMVFEPFERLVEVHRPRLRHVHVVHVDDEPAPMPPPRVETPPVVAAAAPSRAAPRERGRSIDERRATNAAAAAADVAAIVASTRVVERVGALRPEDTYNEDDASSRGFGGSPRFPPGETIKTGEGYKVMSYDVRLCPAKSCKVTGPVPSSFVRAQLHEHMDAIYGCYTTHAEGPGTITLEFTIAGDGSVRDARGTGLGETGPCAARVLPEIYFKAIGDNDVREGRPKVTRVRYPIEFR